MDTDKHAPLILWALARGQKLRTCLVAVLEILRAAQVVILYWYVSHTLCKGRTHRLGADGRTYEVGGMDMKINTPGFWGKCFKTQTALPMCKVSGYGTVDVITSPAS